MATSQFPSSGWSATACQSASSSTFPSSTNFAVWTVATKGTTGTLMYIAAASSSPEFWSSVTSQRAKWDVTVNEQTIDVGELSKQNYIGRTPAAALPAALKGSDEWASWVFSLSEVWQDDAPMQDRPLEVHCSGLGGGPTQWRTRL